MKKLKILATILFLAAIITGALYAVKYKKEFLTIKLTKSSNYEYFTVSKNLFGSHTLKKNTKYSDDVADSHIDKSITNDENYVFTYEDRILSFYHRNSESRSDELLFQKQECDKYYESGVFVFSRSIYFSCVGEDNNVFYVFDTETRHEEILYKFGNKKTNFVRDLLLEFQNKIYFVECEYYETTCTLNTIEKNSGHMDLIGEIGSDHDIIANENSFTLIDRLNHSLLTFDDIGANPNVIPFDALYWGGYVDLFGNTKLIFKEDKSLFVQDPQEANSKNYIQKEFYCIKPSFTRNGWLIFLSAENDTDCLNAKVLNVVSLEDLSYVQLTDERLSSNIVDVFVE